MSRIGNKPISLPGNVKVNTAGRSVTVESGGKSLSIELRPEVDVKVDDEAKQIVVTRVDDERQSKAMHGLTRALIANMVTGVTTGFKKDLEINGVGWTANVNGMHLELKIGYADTRVLAIPSGLTVEADGKSGRISVSGIDKQAVGQFAATVRAQRKPEPYNGKGIKYAGEVIVRKEGKALAGGK